MKSYQRTDIAQNISEATGFVHADSYALVDSIIMMLKHTVTQQGTLRVKNFGVFKIIHKAPKSARNWKTGETIRLKAKKTVKFVPSVKLMSTINAYNGNNNE